MFRALLTHPQEVQNKRHLVYLVLIMSIGCGTVAVSRTQYTIDIPNAVFVAPPEDEHVMLKTCTGP
jgi:hypothetical protein